MKRALFMGWFKFDFIEVSLILPVEESNHECIGETIYIIVLLPPL